MEYSIVTFDAAPLKKWALEQTKVSKCNPTDDWVKDEGSEWRKDARQNGEKWRY